VTDVVEITIADERWQVRLDDPGALCRRAADATLAAARTEWAGGLELSIVLADDRMVRALNRKFRHVDRATNVLAFPAGATGTPAARPLPLGDVVLAFQTIESEARAQAKTIDDHLAHLVVHGVLHLLGHDHESEADATTMETLEARILRRLGIADPYLVRDPA
jgi:probable rRNA maturation factor